jgi:hypothetical protein
MKMLRETINRYFDRLVTPRIHLGHKSWLTFHVCGYAGLGIAVLLTLFLTNHQGLSLAVTAVIILGAVFTFYGLVMATKIVTGEERITYYHHEMAVIVVAMVLLGSLHQPRLPYLDVTILGLGAFLVCGRVGCLMTGCCHGRPSHWGVSYREEHAAVGFTPYYVGVRLLPVQAAESLWVLFITSAGIFMVLRSHASGAAFGWYIVMYDLGRFYLEFLRGDPDRPYLWGFSQPQWISLLLICAVLVAELAGVLPFHAWHAGVVLGMVLTMIAAKRAGNRQLLHPRHIHEIAAAIEGASHRRPEARPVGHWTLLPSRRAVTSEVRVGCTSLGVQVSTGRLGSETRHYSISYRDGGMTVETARVIARIVLQLERANGPAQLHKGNRDVFHLLLHESS